MNSTAPKTARIQTPQSKNNPAEVKVEEIPLPPSELWGDLDNGNADVTSASQTTTVGINAAPMDIEEEAIVALDFVANSHRRIISLKYPFRLNGKVVEAITVRRLLIGEVDNFLRKTAREKLSTFDVYAYMAGLPASVLRGLIDEDGDAVTDAAYDFLPRALKGETVSSEN